MGVQPLLDIFYVTCITVGAVFLDAENPRGERL